MKRLVFVVVLVLLAALTTPALAKPLLLQGEPPTFDAFLAALSGPLAAAAVSLALSWLVDLWPKYEQLDPRLKRIVFFALCLTIPIAAAVLRGLLGYVSWSFDPLIWHAIWNGVGAFGVGTLAHTRKLKT
ncbi:MAG: hypothetical protein JW900_04455 [Anaerolineae bacterium]|nr:hypothetical protein [Anaerolineae bacterium]